MFQLVRYPSPAGELAAYVTPDPGDGTRRPVVIWAHGGFGGIGPWLWEQFQYTGDFRHSGMIVFCPSWRGENDNPGRFELFYGEVDDALAAIDYVAELPYVDPNRIYMAGHSTGGTLTLLTALASTKLRAAFPFGGAPDVTEMLEERNGWGNTPFPTDDPQEGFLRSAKNFVSTLEVPTFYFEGSISYFYCVQAMAMEEDAEKSGVPFQAHIITMGSHFDILSPINELIAAEILKDTGETCSIELTKEQVQEQYQGFNRRMRDADTLEQIAGLRRWGMDLSKPVPITLFLSSTLKRDIDLSSKQLTELGHESKEPEKRTDSEGSVYYLIEVTKEFRPIDVEEVFRITEEVFQFADENGLNYGGWRVNQD